MRILFALTRFPYPLLKGDKLRAYYQIKELSKEHEIHLVCICNSSDSKYLSYLEPFCKSITLVHQNPIQIALHLLKSFFFSEIPFQVAYFSVPKARKIIDKLITEHKIEVCYVQLIRMTNNISYQLPIRYILDYMDSFSLGIEKRLRYAPFYLKWLLRLEHKKLIKFETGVAECFSACTIISEQDKINLNPRVQEKTVVIPNGIDTQFFVQNLNQKEETKDIDLIFTGNMAYYPNVMAAHFIIDEIITYFKAKNVALNLYIVGTSPDKSLLNKQQKNIVVTGFVKNVMDYLTRAKLFVAPLFTGSGLQNKLLEAMAAGVPVITTSSAAIALGAENEKELFTADSALEFNKQIEQLLFYNPNLSKQLIPQAQNFVRKNFSWEQSCGKLSQVMRGNH